MAVGLEVLPMSGFGARLRSKRQSQGISGNKLAQMAGLDQALLNGIENGRRPPSDTNLEALAAVAELGLDLETLRAWRALDRLGDDFGPLMRHLPELVPQVDPKVAKLAAKLSLHTAKTAPPGDGQMGIILSGLRPPASTKPVKYLGKVGANRRVHEVDDGEREVPADSPRADYCVEVVGDSMDALDHPKLPPMPPGSLLLVKKNKAPKPGAVVIVENDGALLVKKLVKRHDGRLQLVSESMETSYPVIPWDDDDDVKPLGEVIGVVKREGR